MTDNMDKLSQVIPDKELEQVVGGTQEVFVDVRNHVNKSYQDKRFLLEHHLLTPAQAASEFETDAVDYRNKHESGLDDSEKNEIDRIIRVNRLQLRNWTDC